MLDPLKNYSDFEYLSFYRKHIELADIAYEKLNKELWESTNKSLELEDKIKILRKEIRQLKKLKKGKK